MRLFPAHFLITPLADHWSERAAKLIRFGFYEASFTRFFWPFAAPVLTYSETWWLQFLPLSQAAARFLALRLVFRPTGACFYTLRCLFSRHLGSRRLFIKREMARKMELNISLLEQKIRLSDEVASTTSVHVKWMRCSLGSHFTHRFLQWCLSKGTTGKINLYSRIAWSRF